ncbi:aldose 1-epimerase family protein, partial [Bifidobacterium animalis]
MGTRLNNEAINDDWSPMSALPPRTGQQFSISHGDYTAVIAQLGATLRVFRYQGDDVTVSTGPDDVVTCCVGRVLVPFPNRLEHGSYDFDGAHYQLPINEPERDNAIHGFGMNYYWQLERLTEDSVTLSWRVPLTEGYPFSLQVFITYTLSNSGMRIDCDAVNNGDGPAPWAMAVHPWFSNGEDAHGNAIDAVTSRCSVQIPANTHVLTNGNLIPTGTEPVDGTKFDFRTAALLDRQPYDDALTDLTHAADGTVTAVFTRPDGRQVAIIGDESITSFQVCTGTGFPEAIHPTGVAVEPQTAYANTFRTGIDLIE